MPTTRSHTTISPHRSAPSPTAPAWLRCSTEWARPPSTALRPRGILVVYGNASGPTPPLEIPRLNTGGSLYVTRSTVVHYTATADELRRRTDDLFAWLAEGALRVHIGGRFPVSQVSEAFTALEARQTTGKLLLVH